jgi:hypothetical protein
MGSRRGSDLRLKSMPSMAPVAAVEAKLLELGFNLASEATVVSDNRFWRRRLYTNGYEVVTLSDEIGRLYHLKDPVVTICGREKTIEAIRSVLSLFGSKVS